MKYTTLILGFLIPANFLIAQVFTEDPQSPLFEGVRYSALTFFDGNNDGYQDVFLTGQSNSNESISQWYINDSLGNFSLSPDTVFTGLLASSIAVADVNNDGYQDVLLTGTESFSSTERMAKLYLNDSLGNFSEVENTPFDGVWFGAAAFADVNSDGNQDVLITGRNSLDLRISKLYTNDGQGNFTEVADTPFEGVWFSDLAFADVNGDEYQDVLIVGQDSLVERVAKLYTNDGQGNFTEVEGTPFEGVWEGSVAFADVNGNGHLDVFITGTRSSGIGIAKLYTNDGQGNFTEMMDTPFDGVWRSTMSFSDINNDGHQDVLIAGQNNLGQRVSKLYTNDGSGIFTEIFNTPFEGVRFGAVASADVNRDSLPDIFITGQNSSNESLAKLYINEGDVSSYEVLTLENPLEFSLYPNPIASGQLSIICNSTESETVQLTLLGSSGQLLREQRHILVPGQNILSADVSSFTPGLYFIQLENGQRSGVKKLIIP